MQTKPIYFRSKTRILISLAAACVMGVTMAAPSAVYAQDRRDDRRDDNRNRRDDSQNRRDDSRDHRDTSRDHRDSRDDRRADSHDSHRSRDESHVRFTHSQEERRFNNGIVLHRGVTVVDKRFDVYFPHHVYSYPHYALTRETGRVVVSPFSFYVGIFPPYIDRSSVFISAPSRVYIDVPIYRHGDFVIESEIRDRYDLNRRSDDDRWRDDRDLSQTVYDLEDTFRNEDIGLLAPLTDPGVRVAIFSRGRYQYSLSPNDYLDMTRDFLRNVHTNEFTAYRVHRKSGGVYQVFAKHTYEDRDGRIDTVYQTIVLERIQGRWTITQVDTSPAHFDR